MTTIVNKSVPICDDDAHIRESTRYVVNKECFSSTTVEVGIAAYQTASKDKPDLVILDVRMPSLNGYDVCKKLRETTGMQNTKILILTTFGQTTDREKAINSGGSDFMTKPFSPHELRSKICALLEMQV